MKMVKTQKCIQITSTEVHNSSQAVEWTQPPTVFREMGASKSTGSAAQRLGDVDYDSSGPDFIPTFPGSGYSTSNFDSILWV
jgi:hypothetical protein